MKQIIVVVLVITIIGSIVFSLCGCSSKLNLIKHENTVYIGLSKPITIIHTTDTHLTRCSENDSEDIQKYAKKRSKRFEYLQEQKLEYISNLSKESGNMIIHTGDILDFVTDDNIAYAANWINSNDCLYVYGNHETDNATKETFARLAVISDKNLYSHYAEERDGILFVGINNSQHKMTLAQLEFLKEMVATGKPIVLFIHVPLYSKDLYEAAMDDGDSAYLMAVPEELMKDYPQNRYNDQLADEITLEAYDYIKNKSGIKAIISGHLHFDFETNVGDIPEFVTDLDSYRIITFE